MSRPQFATREGWLICPECEGRSFSDPLKAYHYPECSRYRDWRFGPKAAPTKAELISDKVRLDEMEDRAYENFSANEEGFMEQWREVEGSDEW